MRDNEKQIITREVVEKELLLQKQKYKKVQFKIAFPRIIATLFITVAFVLLITWLSKWSLLTVIIAVFGLCGGTALIVTTVIEYHRLDFAEKESCYFITKDILINKEKWKANDIAENALFDFQKYKRTFAVSSEYYGNSDFGAFDAAEVNDTFYLLVYKKQILCVYNTKFYELDEELQKELRR